MKSLLFIFTILLLFTNTVKAQSIILKGKVLTTNNIALPFASVYLENSVNGTSANHEGDFDIHINKATHTLLLCTAIGYKTKKNNIDSLKGDFLNIVLEAENYKLTPISVISGYPFTGNKIIQKAIANRTKNQEIYNRYSVNVYVKSMQKLVNAPKRFLGINVKKQLNLDSKGQGILYLSESQSQLYFQSPNNIKEIMISSQSLGKQGGFPINKASDLTTNFYQNLINWPTLSSQSFVSPIADNAIAFYNYKLIGISNENATDVYKIQVLPKRKYDPVFAGFIYIVKNSFKIYGLNLYLTKKANINFVDSLVLKQQYILENNNWLPSTINFKFYGKILGFSFEGFLSGIYNNYNPHPKFEPNFFNKEIHCCPIKEKRDSNYRLFYLP